MATKDEVEEVEHYYKNNPQKPDPHANVQVGSKELGPTRADLEQEKERKFRINFRIESDANAARLKGEKADVKAEAARQKREEIETIKKEPFVKRVARGVGNAVEDIGPNPFGRTVTRGKKGTTRTSGFSPPSINSGFSSGGFPSMNTGFGSSFNPSFPAFDGGGGGKQGGGMSSGLGFPKMSIGFPSMFGGSEPAPRRKRRKTKKRSRR